LWRRSFGLTPVDVGISSWAFLGRKWLEMLVSTVRRPCYHNPSPDEKVGKFLSWLLDGGERDEGDPGSKSAYAQRCKDFSVKKLQDDCWQGLAGSLHCNDFGMFRGVGMGWYTFGGRTQGGRGKND
jgi:hypothetical protein